MHDDELTRMRGAAERIGAVNAAVLDDLQRAAERIAGIFAELGEVRPERAALARVQPVLQELIEAHRGFVGGAGLALDRDHLADAPRWMEWWRRGDDEELHFVRHHLAPDDRYFYDYASREWFAAPHRALHPVVTGPFIDFAGTDEHTVTFAIPVRSGEFVDVVGADASVAGFEELLVAALGAPVPEVLLINGQSRVVASTSARWGSGTLFRGSVAEAVALGGGPSWTLVRPQLARRG